VARARLVALVVLTLLLAPIRPHTEKKARGLPVVVIFVIDGTRWDAIEGIESFGRLEKSGFRAKKMRSVFPSQTCPSQATIATGVRPAVHGIVSNQFLDKETGERFSHEKEARWLKAAPIWVIAERSGLRTAVSEWPLSEGVWEGVKPSEYRPYSPDNTDREAVDWTLSLLDRKSGRPSLVMTWLRACDKAGHDNGPGSPEYREAARRTGALLESFVNSAARAGADRDMVLLVTSDHGMKAIKGEIDIVPFVPKKKFYPYIAPSGSMAMVYTDGPGQRASVVNSLKRIKSRVEIYPSPEVPSEYSLGDSPRVGDILALAPSGFTFAPFKRGPHKSNSGYHGWPPSDPDMCGVFFALGPGVPKRAVEEARILDIAPTALKLLGLEVPSGMEGRPLF